MSTNTNNENAVYKDAAKVSIFILLFGIVEFIVLTAFLSLRLDILLGVAYGCAFSVFSFFYLAFSVKKSVDKDEKAAKAYMAMSYNARMLLTAVAIIIAVKVESIHLWSAIIPLFFQRPSVYAVSFTHSLRKKRSEKS